MRNSNKWRTLSVPKAPDYEIGVFYLGVDGAFYSELDFDCY